MENLKPKEIILLSNMIAIRWDDDTETLLNNKRVREACPCAFCSGETDALGNKHGGQTVKSKEDITILNFMKVGHYGIRLFWSDGHADGIYTYKFLFALSSSND